MIHTHDSKVWIAVEQRLDGLNARRDYAWPDPYLTITLDPGKDVPNVEINLSIDLAKRIARGLNKAAKRAES